MTNQTDRIIRLPQVLEITGLSRSTMLAMVKAGDFPKQVQIAPRCVGWRLSDVMAWLESLESAQ